jgi:hypothetical protein
MERGKLTSINMKVSSRLHNQRTTLAEQNYRLGALLNQRPTLYKITELHTYTQNFCKQQQRRAWASMVRRLLSQTVQVFLCQMQTQISMGLQEKPFAGVPWADNSIFHGWTPPCFLFMG